ncbi:HAMP domain-containing protein [Pseudomonas sp. JQ170]|uniref:HD domain-containing phosphohydrolase n=1 Tax=unclassified Pseudomonas TaxID=196821 RepID=UPI0026505BF1|nr:MULTISPECIES: HD domain-containing phosphohydrolase [unclassified Pseudomonas]MDN7142360.1 HAMP domain-containing protein [Pseudomonas sp. JQ170]WRO74075.1 HD domain-containing phosphohydrolase [Pseudomonas sp. 170C]
MNQPRRGFPLQVLIGLAIMFSTLVLCGVLAYQGYHGIKQALVAASAESTHQLGRTINERAQRLIDPVLSTIRLLAHDPISHAQNLQQRLDRLPLLVASLSTNATLSAVYVGYPNGEFLLARTLRTDAQKQDLQAPAGTAYLVQSISLDESGQLQGEWRFYDPQLKLLERLAKPDYRFDPRTRPWFVSGMASAATVLTKPYVFFTTREIGLTMAQRSIDGAAVMGMDASVNDLGGEVEDLRMTPGTEMAVVDSAGSVIIYPDLQRVVVKEGEDLRLSRLDELGVASLDWLLANDHKGLEPVRYQAGGKDWYGIQVPLSSFVQHDIRMLIAIPATELLIGARQALLEAALWASVLTALLLLVGWALARRIAQPLQALTQQVHALAGFDFAQKVGVDSRITEVRELSQVLGSMSRTINNFQAITLTLSRETDLDKMLGEVLGQLVEATSVEGGAVYLQKEASDALHLAAHCRGDQYPAELTLEMGSHGDLNAAVAHALQSQAHYLAVALNDRSEHLLGILVLQLRPQQQPGGVQQPFRQFVQELSGAAAVAIETRQLVETQQRLLDAIIKLLADATDAKSPYTGGHCQRVPQLAEMLLDKVIEARSGPYADYRMSELERYEFRIAAWLHDCGKVTSPEYVVDKATKLETLYNRIHEIRTRFEVLWRDLEVDYWKGMAAGGDQQALQWALESRRAELQDEFAFVANANIGGEFMSDEAIERLKQIGARRWERHFDNRLGLSRDESERLAPVSSPALPAQEQLLADRADHIVPWGERKPPVDKHDPRNIWGFDMRLPAQAYNYGELYNLSIRRGTLTDEERFKINEHIVQTIIMLNTLPLPNHLKRVPSIAGNHHEKMDGTGYPRRLRKDDMSIAERVMAIADIFEALSAADRPYKAAKTLSESVKILGAMARDQHIDADLFRLFLTTGVYRQYGEKFLRREQLDDVDIQPYLAALDAV